MVSNKALAAAVGFFVVSVVSADVVMAADIGGGAKPAVSGVNGKIHIDGGYGSLDTWGSSGIFDGAASISVPVGDAFGLQADFAAKSAWGNGMAGGTLHAFTRNPDSYLLGVIGGAAFSNNANLLYTGPEFELYSGSFTIEATGGYLRVNPAAAAGYDTAFGFVDLGYYATDDFRFTLGASDIGGFKTAHAGLEYQLSSVAMPVSLTGDVRAGDHNFVSALAGVTFYFGGENKSLIRRHREDDPRNRSLDIFGASGGSLVPGGGKPPPAECIPVLTNNFCGTGG